MSDESESNIDDFDVDPNAVNAVIENGDVSSRVIYFSFPNHNKERNEIVLFNKLFSFLSISIQ